MIYSKTYRLCLLIFIFILGADVDSIKAQSIKNETPKASPVEVVFVVDISSSTGGILASVKLNFWEIINEMNRFKPLPDFKLSLVCLGRPSFGEENGYVKIMAPLTNDIDLVANELFSIKESTAKGKVLMGDALHAVIHDIKWSKDPKALKIVFIVGNGGVYNGYNFLKACEAAKEKNIILNTLYFKTYDNKKEVEGWQLIAKLTDGNFFIIGLKEPNIFFEKSYDNDLLIEASTMINNSYVPYGKEGVERKKIQIKLDEEAKRINDNSMEARAFFKSSTLYQDKNINWDLVDLTFNSSKLINFSSFNRELMDESNIKMTDGQLGEYVATKTQERIEYVNILKMLSTKREEFLKMKKKQMEQYRFGDTFFGVVNKTIVKLCNSKGFATDY